jgi:hypothetical protein
MSYDCAVCGEGFWEERARDSHEAVHFFDASALSDMLAFYDLGRKATLNNRATQDERASANLARALERIDGMASQTLGELRSERVRMEGSIVNLEEKIAELRGDLHACYKGIDEIRDKEFEARRATQRQKDVETRTSGLLGEMVQTQRDREDEEHLTKLVDGAVCQLLPSY